MAQKPHIAATDRMAPVLSPLKAGWAPPPASLPAAAAPSRHAAKQLATASIPVELAISPETIVDFPVIREPIPTTKASRGFAIAPGAAESAARQQVPDRSGYLMRFRAGGGHNGLAFSCLTDERIALAPTAGSPRPDDLIDHLFDWNQRRCPKADTNKNSVVEGSLREPAAAVASGRPPGLSATTAMMQFYDAL